MTRTTSLFSRVFGLLATLCLVTSTIGCDDSGGPHTNPNASTDTAADTGGTDATGDGDTTHTDGGQQVEPDAVSSGDAGPSSPLDAPDPDPLNRPLTTAPLPAAITVTDWVYAIDTGGSSVASAMLAGTFVTPKAGDKAYGLNWQAAKINDKGAFSSYGGNGGAVWVACTPGVKQATAAVSSVKNVLQIYFGDRRLPGDLYGHDLARVPVWLQPGKPIAARTRGGRAARIQLQTTERELWLNPHDMTRPDLRAGADTKMWHGMPLLNLRDKPVSHLHARVLDNEHFHPSNTWFGGIAPMAVTHVGFHLRPKKPWPAAGDKDNPVVITAKLRIEAKDAQFAYDYELKITVIANDVPYRQTFRSPVDASVQYYGVRPPKPFDPEKTYSLALSLHGAGVAGIGQAKSYGPKDWIYIIAPTNRRRFGFDHEEWGHLNDLAALNDATSRFNIDIDRRYVTGHSMGGHGTWQFGIHHAGLFAVVGPSAGWDSFYTYGKSPKPSYPLSRARAHSDTSKYIGNLANRGVYIIHGTADNNVPWSEGLNMHNKCKPVTKDLHHHWQQGAGHWWDDDKDTPGAGCVDWKPLFDLMKERKRDPAELNFTFTSPGPWYSDHYSYVRILSSTSPLSDCTVQSTFDGAKLVLKTVNVRTMEIDGSLVRKKGPQVIEINGTEHKLTDDKLLLGPTTGKRPGVHSTFNQVMHTPWCWVYPQKAQKYGQFAAYLSTHWAIIGNGHGCTIAAEQSDDVTRKRHGYIYLGVPRTDTTAPDGLFDWNDSGVSVGGKTFTGGALQTTWDNGQRLDAAIVAAQGKESLLYQVIPFSSRSGMPDFLAWDSGGLKAGGFYDSEWKLNKSFAVGL